ncbi:MAG: Rrf2 family transcriptional regulator [Ruminococcaceae bacterium]|nr:Rrf2 family transcriptional regulator [Oscillospiraceae bacterium]
MMISTRGRYALRILIDLAEHADGGFTPMKEAAARQDISLKYLEKILPVLTKSGMIEGQQGKGGGYRLTKDPDEYRVYDILRLTEEELAPVACLTDGAKPCERAAECRTLAMWQKFYDLTRDYFSGITLADLMRSDSADMYVI